MELLRGENDSCEEAFRVLQQAFRQVAPNRVTDESVDVWPADPSGRETHPRIPNWQGEQDVSWREVASFIRFKCNKKYEVESLAADQDSRFYDEGVVIRRKPAQNFPL